MAVSALVEALILLVAGVIEESLHRIVLVGRVLKVG